MAVIRGCQIPEDLYYWVDKHIWVKPVDGDRVRIGMTTVAGHLVGGKLIAVTYSQRKLGRALARGRSVATVESSKYVGPVPSPVAGVLETGNPDLETNPSLAITDPYGAGWIAELTATAWDEERAELVTGDAAVAALTADLEQNDITCGS